MKIQSKVLKISIAVVIGVIFLLVIYQKNNDTSHAVTIADFENIKLGTSYSDIEKRFGPAKDIGSGLHIFMYELADKSQVLLGFADINHLLYIKHRLSDGTINDLVNNVN